MSIGSHHNRPTWSGQLAFILAAAASAIGLGNLWRFPYLAAQYGGGIFIVIYLALVVTLGFTLMTTEIAIGRKTQQSQLTAFTQLHKGFGFLGLIGTIVPFIIVSYYCVIGGWVIKYFRVYAEMVFCGTNPMGDNAVNAGAFFEGFIASPVAPFAYNLIFLLACAVIIILGVKKGIEKSNTIMMPLLFLLAIAISIYVICLPGALEGVKYYLIPNTDSLHVKNDDGTSYFSFALLAKTILGAMGQMFYSLSLAMGIMITYGSYMRKSDSIELSVRRIEIFDTIISIIAGLLIIPGVYIFAAKSGKDITEAMNAGPGLMFATLPQVFASIGAAGPIIGLAFFALVTFAAATSAISLYEACVASLCDLTKIKRRYATLIMGVLITLLSTFSAFGYGRWGTVTVFGWQFLDFFDFVSNSVIMPILAALTCIFVGWVIKPKEIIDECEHGGALFKRKGLYIIMVKWIAPLLVIAILISEICRALKIGGWSI